ncbi:MAG TPA: GNAT family protein [Caulobacteraceae bacterium]|jgi:RimJ/RimL family protein N-acetyltransferase|nr:GNAT family protein [Caulobacteraceae bacterium]
METTPWPPAVTLEGQHAVLAPLSPDHAAALADAARDGELWKLWYTGVASPETMAADIERRLSLRADGAMLPFTVIARASGQPVGMTTYMNIEARTPRVEIGSTWYRASVQRTQINTECKLMLLGHAFETLGCPAVELRTHFLNTQSRRAIERLGAKLDGVLRNHMRMPNGTLRDTCVYSILESEWPTVRTHLEWQLQRTR